MHPQILKRVIGNDGTHLRIYSAILLDYTRHQIKHADYPAVIPYSHSKSMFDRELSPEEKSVRGSLVTGLSEAEVLLLDVFEGDEYVRNLVPVYPLSQPTTLSPYMHQSTLPLAAPHRHSVSTLPPPILAHTYIWCKSPTRLIPSLWSFDDFVKNNAWKWAGVHADSNREYMEVDHRRREMGGYIVRCGGGEDRDY